MNIIDTLKEVSTNNMLREILVIYILDKKLIYRMYEEFLETSKKKGNIPIGKWAKVKRRTRSKLLEKIVTVEIREIQIKIRNFNPSGEQN